MFQKVVSHVAGRFSRCRCGREPRHIRTDGRRSNEPVQFIATGSRHSLECSCGNRTDLHANVHNAEAQWGTDYAQLALPLRAPRRRKVA